MILLAVIESVAKLLLAYIDGEFLKCSLKKMACTQSFLVLRSSLGKIALSSVQFLVESPSL